MSAQETTQPNKLRYIKHGTPEDICSSWCRPNDNIHAIVTPTNKDDSDEYIMAKAIEAGRHFFFEVLEIRPAPESLVWPLELSYNYAGGTSLPHIISEQTDKMVVMIIQQSQANV